MPQEEFVGASGDRSIGVDRKRSVTEFAVIRRRRADHDHRRRAARDLAQRVERGGDRSGVDLAAFEHVAGKRRLRQHEQVGLLCGPPHERKYRLERRGKICAIVRLELKCGDAKRPVYAGSGVRAWKRYAPYGGKKRPREGDLRKRETRDIYAVLRGY